MTAPASTHRTAERSVMLNFRCSPAEREEIHRQAREAGVSMQAYLERILLGRPDAQDRRPGPRPRRAQQELELPMTG